VIFCRKTQTSWRWLRIVFWACNCDFVGRGNLLRRTVALRTHLNLATAAWPQLGCPALALQLSLCFILFPALAFGPFWLRLSTSTVRRCGVARTPSCFLSEVVGVTAYAMSIYSVGGWLDALRSLLFTSFFILAIPAWRLPSRARLKLRWMRGQSPPSRHRNTLPVMVIASPPVVSPTLRLSSFSLVSRSGAVFPSTNT